MSFLYPVFLAGAVAIAVPIVLHLLRRDVAPEQPFTAVRLLRRSPPEQTRRRRLRDLRGAGIDYVQLDTSKPLDAALLAYLAARERRK